ncbi:MAG: permease prefix domain 1-containing protein [Bilifractor sp.]|jgi:hypothetical protein
MDTLHNYLENMFMNMPKTEKVLNAKKELGQMMEDRYNELISEGKSENEAVGIVISEFGNLDELAGELGIDRQVAAKNTAAENAHPISLEDAKLYIQDTIRKSILIGLGVCLIILSSSMYLIFEDPESAFAYAAFFIVVALGIGCIVYAAIRYNKWDFIHQEKVQLDFETAGYVRTEKENFSTQYAAFIAAGVILIILSVIPSATIRGANANYAHASLFLLVGLGVMLIIMAGMRQRSYGNLLNDIAKENIDMENDMSRLTQRGRKIMSVFWPTVTCIYLCWSFITFDWGFTWIIWPIAAGVRWMLLAFLEKEDGEKNI